MPHEHDYDLTAGDIAQLTTADALAAFLARIGYDTGARAVLTPEAIGLSGSAITPIHQIELLSEDSEGFLRIVFVRLRSLTAKSRNDLARVLGRTNVDHLLILASDFEILEFVLLDKRKQESRGAAAAQRLQVVPRTFSVNRRSPGRLEMRALRRLTWTGADGLEQYEKLRAAFEAAAFTEEYFQNRALFADHYLTDRLRDDPAWTENPSEAFRSVQDLLRGHYARFVGKGEQVTRDQLYMPAFELLGFKPKENKPAASDHLKPDYLLKGKSNKTVTAAFVYSWDRWLDGPDLNDRETPDENPGACVVSALDDGVADWIIVTNGRLWRLYSRRAHSRATNFYEVDLAEALAASGETDPNEAFRYWWLFFRHAAFKALDGEPAACWLDNVVQGSRDYAKRLGERLKDRVFETIFPHLAQGFIVDRRRRLGARARFTDEELADVFEATLTLLYRLLFLLYAESRDLLPIREAPYYAASLKKIKEEIAQHAGGAESQAAERLQKAYTEKDYGLYDRLSGLCAAMDHGDVALNVPIYNGGLFVTEPGDSDRREERIARFLLEHKMPDRHLALAVDRLARDQDEKTLSLVFIDYKSLEVRHLGSIYEGLLEFKLTIAEEDLTTKTEKKKEKFIPLSKAEPRRGRAAEVVVPKGRVYLSNDKSERKATGSYYTPDPIVEYIVEHTVGPVLSEKLEALRPRFRKVRKTFNRELEKAKAYPVKRPSGETWDAREFALEKVYTEHKDLFEDLFEFRTLDPAMGSGHFLVEAVDFITDRVLGFLNQFPINPVSVALDRTRKNILEALGEQGVSVDAAKLTEVNLLKRHVLKRSIYGVDINPMAVELAKVSLWLDAFTLGAPLSFLDHHLRCGNSLVGATFEDLEHATRGQLFGIDYEPLMRAIHHVLFVNKMADATAAEAKRSADEYDRAREELSGYQIVLDLLVAKHFGYPESPDLLKYGQELDLSSRTAFLHSLSDLTELGLIENVEHLAHRPDRRFFHWEIEFPEVFFGFEDENQRRLKHKNEIAEGSAGFDTVVGNPPYVRQETIKELKDYLNADYTTYNSTNDLYIYFQEREVRKLRAGGRMSMIVANKWMRAGYGERIRAFLKDIAQPLEVVDFGHSPIFPEADTFPCILLVSRRRRPLQPGEDPPDNEEMAACLVPRENWRSGVNLLPYVQRHRHQIPTRLLRSDGWSLETIEVQLLLERIRATGIPLKDYCGSQPLRGLLTGLNEAFVIDADARNRLIHEDPQSAEILKPLLRGRDIDRWRPRSSGAYLITIPSSENHEWPWSAAGSQAESCFKESFPAVFAHLVDYKASLQRRQDQGRYWWELRSCDYMPRMSQDKILYQEIQFHSWFSLDSKGAVVTNKVFLLPTNELALLGVLCSPLAWWHLTRTLPHMKDEALSPAAFIMQNLRVTVGTLQQKEGIHEAVQSLLELTERVYSFEAEQLAFARTALEIPVVDDRVVSWLMLPVDTFLRRVSNLAGKKGSQPAAVTEITRFQRHARSRQLEFLTKQLELETLLAERVEDAYGLTREERQLLRDTRPVRDPIDVLKAKITGKPNHIDH